MKKPYIHKPIINKSIDHTLHSQFIESKFDRNWLYCSECLTNNLPTAIRYLSDRQAYAMSQLGIPVRGDLMSSKIRTKNLLVSELSTQKKKSKHSKFVLQKKLEAKLKKRKKKADRLNKK